MTTPLVSVVIPTYKRASLLPRSVKSVLSQSYHNLEIIVVDDNDPNTSYRIDTESVMSGLMSDTRVKYIKHPQNMNGSAARNTGIRNATGKYIMFLDDDDEFFPEKVARQVACMEERDLSWGACYTKYIRRDGNKLVSICTEDREGYLLKEELMRNLWIGAGSNLMVRKSVIDEFGGFDESFVRNQDVEFLIKILKHYKLAHVDYIGLCCYKHNVSRPKFSYVEVTDYFKKTFKKDIDELSDKDQKDVYEMIDLQLFRYYLTKKDFSTAFSFIKNKKISKKNAVCYLCHLMKRAVKKESCGYKLR